MRIRRFIPKCAAVVGLVVLGSLLVANDGARAATAPPNPVIAATISNPDSNTTLKVTWVPSPIGEPAEWYVAQAISGGRFYGQAWCYETDCTSVSIPGVPPNRYYVVNVYPANFAGYGPPRTSPPYLVTSGCVNFADLCATVMTASPDGAATSLAEGFQNGRPLPPDELAALQPRFWRMGVYEEDYDLFDHARAAGAKVLVILSDVWRAATLDPETGFPEPPWEDWEAYRSFVRSYATMLVNAGRNPDYWDVQNEPGGDHLSPADHDEWTPARMLEQFKIAYEEIRAVDAAAKVIGPSIATYTVAARPMVLDIETFLDYVQANGIDLGAVTWHEANAGNLTGDTTALPVAIEYHVDTVRKLMSTRNLGNPEILISEYGALQMHLIPGWVAGYITSIERADVDGANRTCWSDAGPPTFNQCANRSLSGLFSSGGERLANYWVHRFYAGMAGTRVASRVSTAALSTFATTDADNTVRVLVGRHEQCTANLPFGCAQGLTTQVAKNMTLDVDASPLVTQWHVTVNRIPAATGPLSAPVPMLDTSITPIAGRVSILLNSVNDGDAVTVTLTPAA